MAEPKGPLVNFAFVLLIITAVGLLIGYVAAILLGLIAAFPFGILGFIPLIGILILLYVVVRDQTTSKEDDYYSKNVDQ
jgi:uncharacterized membrane protein